MSCVWTFAVVFFLYFSLRKSLALYFNFFILFFQRTGVYNHAPILAYPIRFYKLENLYYLVFVVKITTSIPLNNGNDVQSTIKFND